MKRNQKGFTLVELLAVIVILAVIILIAVNAVLPQMRKARKNSFIDEVINFGKAAETKYVADSLNQTSSGSAVKCYNLSDLKGTYVAKNDENYVGSVVLIIDGDNITKKVTMTDKNNFYVNNVVPNKSDITVSDYSETAWEALGNSVLTGTGDEIKAGIACPSTTNNSQNNG